MPNIPSLRRRKSAARSSRTPQAAIAAAFLALCPLAHAQSASPTPPAGFSGRIGAGVATMPTYEGRANSRTLMLPEVAFSYRSRDWGSVEFDQRGLTWNAVESGRFRFAVVAQFDLGRKDRDPSVLDPTPGDEGLAGMGDVRSSTEAGFGIGYGPLMVVARQSLGQRGSKGAQVDMRIGHAWALSDRLDLRLALDATWADRDYMQAYFGITAAQAQATSFAEYRPKAGCRKVEASLDGEYAIAPRWTLHANLGFSRLGDDAAASPLVGRRNGTSAGLGLAHAF